MKVLLDCRYKDRQVLFCSRLTFHYKQLLLVCWHHVDNPRYTYEWKRNLCNVFCVMSHIIRICYITNEYDCFTPCYFNLKLYRMRLERGCSLPRRPSYCSRTDLFASRHYYFFNYSVNWIRKLLLSNKTPKQNLTISNFLHLQIFTYVKWVIKIIYILLNGM